MKRILVVIALLAISPAAAQQPQPLTAAEQRLASQIGIMLVRLEQQVDQIATLQEQNTKLLSRIKELEAPKQEPAKK